MKRFTYILFSVTILVLILAACSNPQGGFGPSWDISARIPLLQGNDDNTLEIDELVADMIEGDSGEVGDLISYEELLSESDLEDSQYDIGAELTNIKFPSITGESFKLEPIELDGFIGTVIDPIEAEITPGLDGNLEDVISGSLPSISLELDFDELVFASGSDPIIFSLKRKTNDVEIEQLEITVRYNEGASTTILSFDKVEINSLALGDSAEEEFVLEGLVLTDKDLEIDIFIETTGPVAASPTDVIELSIISPDKVIIQSVENLDTTDLNIEYEVTETIALADMEIDDFIKELAFANGQLSVDIDSISGLKVEWDKLEIGPLLDLDNDGIIPLAGEVINFTSSSLDNINIELTIKKDESNTLTYDATDTVGISGGFSVDTAIEYVIVNLDHPSFDLDDLDKTIDLEPIPIDIDQKFREELSKIDIYPEIIAEFNSLEGLTMDFEGIVVKALDSSGIIIDSFDLGQLEGENPTIDLMAFDTNILDLIKNPNTVEIILDGDFGLAGDNVQIFSDSSVGIKNFTARIPFEFFLSEDIEYELDPVLIGEGIDQDAYEIINKGVKDAKLYVKNLYNNTAIAGKIELYIIEDDSADIYTDGFIIAETVIEARNEADFVFAISVEDAEMLTKENTYLGLKIIIPGGENVSYQGKWGDTISFEDIYMIITAKVNQ